MAYVVDGDTITVTDAEGTSERVRLLGINTPEVARDGEPGQCGGEDATAQLVSGSRAAAVDRYDRLLRYVELEDGTDAGATLIADGYAYAWVPASEPDPDRLDEYEDATATARDADAGAWATCSSLEESR